MKWKEFPFSCASNLTKEKKSAINELFVKLSEAEQSLIMDLIDDYYSIGFDDGQCPDY